MRAKFVFRVISNGLEFPDSAKVLSMTTAKEEIENLIEKYNEVESLRYGDTRSHRELVKITGFEDDFFEGEK